MIQGKSDQPLVSIGLPVYNGEEYLNQAIESVLAQTFTDFELIITDNCSSDLTQQICESYAKRDSRVIYYRNIKNLGAAPNFNKAFELSSGKYFKWLAHDDKIHPNFLSQCVDVLENQPDIVLCYSKIEAINERNETIDFFDIKLRTNSNCYWRRFHDLLLVWHNCFPISGLIRSDVLKQTGLIGSYASGDSVLLIKLGLKGKFFVVPEFLIQSRKHAYQSVQMFNKEGISNRRAYTDWFDTNLIGTKFYPHWRILKENFFSVINAEIPRLDKFFSYIFLLRWMIRMRQPLFQESITVFSEKFVLMKNT